MSLLLSTAQNLYWLGRYMRRSQELVGVPSLPVEQRSEQLSYLGWPTDMKTNEIFEYMCEVALPGNFKQIDDNVQSVRGVIDADAAELFTQVKRAVQADSVRSAGFQLYACAAAMLEQAVPYVTLFWQLGDYVEMLDCRIRYKQADRRHFRDLADVITQLPDGTAWERIKQPIQAMVYTTDARQYYHWRERLGQLFEEGV